MLPVRLRDRKEKALPLLQRQIGPFCKVGRGIPKDVLESAGQDYRVIQVHQHQNLGDLATQHRTAKLTILQDLLSELPNQPYFLHPLLNPASLRLYLLTATQGPNPS